MCYVNKIVYSLILITGSSSTREFKIGRGNHCRLLHHIWRQLVKECDLKEVYAR